MQRYYDAAHELRLRRSARTDVLAFARHIYPNFITGEHHKVIAEKLHAIANGEIKRLMIFCPPRHGKSVMVSQVFPAWYIGNNPTHQIMAISYNDELASDFGRRVRNTLLDDEYMRVFNGLTLAKDSKAVDRWNTSKGGIYIASGIGGTLHGRGANLAIIDDPIRNRAEADSKRTRDLLWQSYETDILSRLMPGGAIVIMHTRWHEDDLAGRIMEREKGWELISLPAISNEHTDKEQALWPEWFPLADMRERRSKVSARTWASLYQQNPQPDIGIFFDMNWFKKRYKTPPKSLAYYITTDFAVTEPDGKTTDENALPDFTEIAVWGIDPDENIYAIDWWFGQTTPDKWFDELCRLIRGYRIMKMYGEGGVIRRAVEAALRKRMQQTRAYAAIEWINPIHDKPTRARSFQALASMGKVYFPETASWLPHVLHQLVSFPAGRNDDAVDACSLIGLAVEQLIHSDDSIKVVKKLPRNVEAWRVV